MTSKHFRMDETITGNTRVFGIIADPIAQVRTPELMNGLLRESRYDGVLVPMHVAAADLPVFLEGMRRQRNFGGFIATVPHKSAMIDLCDEVSPAALSIGAANAVRREPDGRLVADMLDGLGFVGGLRDNGIDPRGKRVYLAGAGGAANAIAFALAQAGIGHITIGNRTAAHAEDLHHRLAASFSGLDVTLSTDPAGHDIAVNATALGMREQDPLPIDVARCDAGTIVAEIIMKPEVTALLAKASRRGLATHPGLPMLRSQIELMASFLGVPLCNKKAS